MAYRFNNRDDEDSFIDDNGDHHLAAYTRDGRAYYADRRMTKLSASSSIHGSSAAMLKLRNFAESVSVIQGLGETTRAFIKTLKKDEVLALCVSDELRPFARCHLDDLEKARGGNRAAAARAIFTLVKDFLFAEIQKRGA